MKIGRSSVRTKTLLYFLLANYAISLVVALPLLSYGPGFEDPFAWLYTHIAYLSNFALILLVLGLILWPFTRWIASSWQIYVLPPALLYVYQVFLSADVHIYEIFRYHLNGLVWNTLTTEGAEDSVHVGGTTLTAVVIYLLVLMAVEWGSLALIVAAMGRAARRERPSYFLRGRIGLVALSALLITVFADKGIFAYANFNERTDIIRYQKLFPLYLPLFADETLEKYLGVKKPHPGITYQAKSSLLQYPAKGFQVEDHLKPINIVWVAVESWRFDMMNAEITPNIEAFSRRALVFENHYSGGNATRFGVFSLFYGIYATYWHQFLAERQSPVFMDTLQREGYQFKIMSSTQLSYPETRSTSLVHIPSSDIEDRLPGNGGPDRDPLIARKFDQFIAQRDTKRPFFSFMFLDSPHAPYRYPAAYAKFQPTVDEINYFEVKKANAAVNESHPLFNRYKNAIYFTDSAVGEILNSIRKRGLLNSTVVVITGDHGEEFYETGYFGHTSAFSRYQTQVPFILYVPGEKPGRVTRLTSHLDLVPTMMSLMGSKIDPATYSHGRSLLDLRGEPYVVSSGWDTFAIIDPGATVVLSSEIYNTKSAEVHVGDYQVTDRPKPILVSRSAELLEVTRRLGNFLR
jgi:hypothetical protein